MLKAIGLAAAGLAAVEGARAQCEPAWSDVFRPAFMRAGDEASATLFDNGSGERLVVAGLARRGDPERGLQVWDGIGWSTLALPAGASGERHLVGAFSEHAPRLLLADLDATESLSDVFVLENGAWRSTGFPAGDSSIRWAFGFAEGSDPSGEEMYVYGLFNEGAGKYSLIYRFDGKTWTPIDTDSGSSSATSLVWHDDGSGRKLYAGIRTKIDGTSAAGVARWDGTNWEEVGGGCPVSWPTIAVHDDGSGPTLWALGADATSLARWDGQTWTSFAIESRQVFYSWRLQSVALDGRRELVWLDRTSNGASVWRWDGIDGEFVGGVAGGWANDIVGDETGALGGGLLAAGNFIDAGGVPAACVAGFDGRTWRALGTGDTGNGLRGSGGILSVGEDGGAALGGRVYTPATRAGGAVAHGVATWDGEEWLDIGPAGYLSAEVHAIARGDMGAGERIFAAGNVKPDSEGGQAVVAWDGAGWSVIGDGIKQGTVYALASGSIAGGSPMLYVAGSFDTIGGASHHAVAGLDQGGWHALGNGLQSSSGQTVVEALALHDDGSGAALYAGGHFHRLGSALADGVVRWNGTGWARIGDRLDDSSAIVNALCSGDLGSGSRLFAGGSFDGVGGDMHNVAAWDGQAWSPLGDGLSGPVNTLAVITTEGGPRLAAGVASGVEGSETVFLWDGASWAPFGAETDGPVYAVAQATHEHGALYIAGRFSEAGGVPSEGIARWGCMDECAADFNGDDVVDSRDLIAYLNAWAAGDANADTDGNGVVDSRDFIAFLNVWNAGC